MSNGYKYPSRESTGINKANQQSYVDAAKSFKSMQLSVFPEQIFTTPTVPFYVGKGALLRILPTTGYIACAESATAALAINLATWPKAFYLNNQEIYIIATDDYVVCSVDVRIEMLVD